MRAVVVVVLFACLAAAAWFLFGHTEVQPPQISPGQTATADATAALALAVQAPAAKEASIDGSAVEANAVLRTVAAPTFEGPAGDVQVVRFDDKAPIAGATVYCWPPDFDWQKLSPESQELMRTDNDAFLRRVGLAFTTDAKGRCRVPLGKSGTSVTATKDELWGQGHVRKDATEPSVVLLRVDQTLHVRVIDAGRKPVAGSMVLGKRAGERPGAWQVGISDAAGRTQYRHVQVMAGEGSSTKIEFVASMPGGESPFALVDVTAPPPEVLLQLPPGGTVKVRVLDNEGKPVDPTFLGDPTVRLATFTEKPGGRNAEADGVSGSQGGVPLDERGEAVFSPVAFGRFVLASVGWSQRSGTETGPTLAHPNVEITVREGADDIVLIGSLLDADGRPLAKSSFSASCKYERGMGSMVGRTDAAGRFRVALRFTAGQAVAVSFGTWPPSAFDPQAVELAPRQLTKGRNDLGEVRLARHSVLVEGKVVMADGGEPANVQINVERKDETHWQQEMNLHPEWGTAGAFVMRSGIAKGTPIRLVIHTPGFLPVAPIECAAGDKGIEIKLQKGGSALATFLVGDELPLERLLLRFQRTDVAPERDPHAAMMERLSFHAGHLQPKDGRVQREWSGLQPGRYRLQALCLGVAEPIVAIDAVEITDGPCADPRLVDIDLRGRVRAFEIRATASDGTVIAARDAFVMLRSTGDEWNGFNLAGGVVKIAAPAAVDLIVIAKGHKVAFVNSVFDARTIALEAAPEARFALTLPSPLPAGATVRLTLKPSLDLPRRARVQLDTGRGMGADNFFVDEAVVAASGKVTVPVRYPGTYTLEATVGMQDRGGAYIRDFEPRTVTLPATGEVALKVGAKGFDRAIEMMRR